MLYQIVITLHIDALSKDVSIGNTMECRRMHGATAGCKCAESHTACETAPQHEGEHGKPAAQAAP